VTASTALVTVGLIWKIKKLPEPVVVVVAAIVGLVVFPAMHK
jgi:chromate transporter